MPVDVLVTAVFVALVAVVAVVAAVAVVAFPVNDPLNDPDAITVSVLPPLNASIALVTCSA